MSPRSRLLALSLAPILYVGAAAIRATGVAVDPIVATALVPLALFFLFRVTDPKTVGEDLVGEGPRTGARLVAAGIGLYVVARSAGVGRAAFDAAAAAGIGVALSAALYGLARVPEGRGLLPASPVARRLDAAFAMVLVAAITTTVPTIAALSPTRGAAIDPLAIDYALVAEAASGLSLLAAATLRMRIARRLELGVVDRAAAAMTLAWTALAVSVPASVLGFGAPDRILPAAALLAATGAAIVCAVADATVIGRSLRTLLVVSILGTPIALLTSGVTAQAPRHAGPFVLFASVVLVLVGVLSRRIAARMTPEAARWLGAIVKAQEAATIPEPHSALRATLAAVRDHLGPSAPSPVLFRVDPPDQLTVDRAGYLHEAPGTAPKELYGYCDAEPEHTFRLEVARALEVRAPHVRPALAWMEAHGLASLTSLRDEDGPVGLLALPRAGRRSPLTLEEVLALGKLGDRVASVLALSSSLASARKRQLDAEAAQKKAEEEAAKTRLELTRGEARHAAHARVIAREAPAFRYAPASRLADAEIAEAVRREKPIVLLVPPGVPAASFAAAAHLDGPRRDDPFVVADGADAREHPVEHWLDRATSPVLLARGGTLVVLDAPALPEDVQRMLARVAGGGLLVAPGGEEATEVDVLVVATVRETVGTLLARGRLVEELADVLGDRAIAVPPLAQRAEDLRAIALDRLARFGLALRGAPLGLADDALAALLEHGWPGNDDELHAVLLRAAVATRRPVVGVADLEAAGFRADAPPSRARASSRPRK